METAQQNTEATQEIEPIYKLSAIRQRIAQLGYKKITPEQLPDLQIRFMEEQRRLWTFTLERHNRLKHDKTADLSDIDAEEKPIIDTIIQLFILIHETRAIYRRAVSNSEKAKQETIAKCKADPLHFINYWCRTVDPRLNAIGCLSQIPFILFPQQETLLRSIHSWYTNRLSGLINKSREEGVTWLVIAYIAWQFLFSKGFTAILGSEKEEKVDFAGSMDTLFGKLRFLIYDLPAWMRPPELATRNNFYDKQRLLINPTAGNEIKGEIGDNIGRSGRSSLLVIDEYQDIAHPEVVRNSVSTTANCKIYIGTIKGMNHFYLLKNSGEVQVQEIWWYHDPRKNTSWKEAKPDLNSPWRKFIEQTESPTTIAQEIDGNPNASVEGSVIPAEWVEKAVDWLNPPDNADKVGGFDVATGKGENEAVYIMRQGPVASKPFIAPFHTPKECAWSVIEQGEIDGITLLNYDMDGIGESLIGLLENSERPIPFRLNGLRGNGRASDEIIPEEGRRYSEKYANKRAERWFALRKRFERTYEHRMGLHQYPIEQLISIPNDTELKAQLSQPMIKQGARLGVESKEHMKSRGIKSPDRADALVYAFSDYDDYGYITNEFDYSAAASHCQIFNINHEHGNYEQYVSIYQNKDLSISAIVAQWWPAACASEGIKNPLVRVYSEIVLPNAMPEELIEQIRVIARTDVYPIKEWIANAEMFGDENSWNRSPDRLFARAGVRLKKNHEYDERGAITFMNMLFHRNQVVIHTLQCKELILQLAQWRRTKGKPAESLGLAKAFTQLLTRFREARKMQTHGEPKYYRTQTEWDMLKYNAIKETILNEAR